MINALNISSSALVAERLRMTQISSNIANISTTHNEAGEAAPYKRKFVVFQADNSIGSPGAPGVKVCRVQTDNSEPRWRTEPGNPDAVKEGPLKGQVAYPNIDMMHEFTDGMEAARVYEANLGAIEITKDIQNPTLRIIA
jgi:flagellar basal-body rod protein FlgC